MTAWYAVTLLLARDVTIGGLSSPLLCWLGAGGVLLFFGWQVTRLFRDASRATASFRSVHPLLVSLADEIEPSDLQRTYARAVSEGTDFLSRGSMASTTDIDRLLTVDRAMRETEAFRRPWIQFRKTLLIERAPWFKNPHIYSTRGAEDFFTQEKVLGASIDLGFYGQVPSLITGFGLVLTFVAICIGLSRLHAEAATITGVQGLINGLAGKFLTSIVALVCANVFILLERPAVRRLLELHGEFVTLVDESFPRRTVEDLLDVLGRQQTRRPTAAPDGHDDAATLEIRERLRASLDELTSAVRRLADRAPEPRTTGAGDPLTTTIRTHRRPGGVEATLAPADRHDDWSAVETGLTGDGNVALVTGWDRRHG
jgi:hypothetical protein